jgi:hypothetical protein
MRRLGLYLTSMSYDSAAYKYTNILLSTERRTVIIFVTGSVSGNSL